MNLEFDLRKLIKLAKQSVLTYILAQIITGVEGGIGIAFLCLYYKYEIPTATALVVPTLYPLLIIQMVVIYLLINKIGKQPEQNPPT